MGQSHLRVFGRPHDQPGQRVEPAGAPPAAEERPSGLPQRYRLRSATGEPTALVCDEAPRINAHVRREFAYSLAEARELGERVILLDGAGSFGPLIDNKRRLYNLDHHQGCERTFTLATCEQALLLVRGGLDLGEGDWSIYANEPDLDTVLALWCLLNHARLRELRPEVRDVLYPMFRLEGAIDANGNELAEVCGLPARVFEQAKKRLDGLLAQEQAVKGGGDWQTLDLETYTAEMLGAIDRLVYSVEDFRGYASIEEVYGHVEIGKRSVAVVCRDKAGIYAVEKLLKERWGDQLGVIALEKEPGHYTLRRASTLSSIDLEDAYALLNKLDRNVDGRPPGKRWGGSESIGGSPRPTGSAFDPTELLRVLGEAFAPSTAWRQLGRLMQAGLCLATLAAVAVPAGTALADALAPLGAPHDAIARTGVALMVLLGSALFTSFASERRSWLHGWRRAGGAHWAPFFLGAALLALPLRGLFPAPASLDAPGIGLALGVVLLTALALEAAFRGLVHGLLLRHARLAGPDERGPLSGAGWLSAGLYALTVALLSVRAIWGGDFTSPVPPVEETALVALSAGCGGLALASLRERSRSLWPGVGAQLLGGCACVALWLVLAR